MNTKKHTGAVPHSGSARIGGNDPGGLILYRTPDGKAEVRLKAMDGSAWLSQAEMAELFDSTKQNISLHIRNILKEGELPESAVVLPNSNSSENS